MDEEIEIQSEIIEWLVKGVQLLSAKIWVQTQICLLLWAAFISAGQRHIFIPKNINNEEIPNWSPLAWGNPKLLRH